MAEVCLALMLLGLMAYALLGSADLVLKVAAPSTTADRDEVSLMRTGAIYLG